MTKEQAEIAGAIQRIYSYARRGLHIALEGHCTCEHPRFLLHLDVARATAARAVLTPKDITRLDRRGRLDTAALVETLERLCDLADGVMPVGATAGTPDLWRGDMPYQLMPDPLELEAAADRRRANAR